MLNQSSTKIQETQFYYDGLALGNVAQGNQTKEADWITGSTYATKQDTYNSYGLVTQSIDPRNNTTTYSYDTYNLYPATTTNPLSQASEYQYDYSTGKPTETTDPNGDVTQTIYDGLGRTLAALQPDPNNPPNLETSTAYVYTDTSDAVSVHESDYMSATSSVDTYSYYDGLDRLIQTRKSSGSSGVYKVTDKIYNPLGLVAEESLPYFASSSARTAAITIPSLFTVYTYDPLQRTLTTANAVGTTTDSYANWETKTIDPNGNEKDTFDDAYGNLVQVNEHNGTSTYSTYYAYDGLQDLTKITDAEGNVRNFTYDGLQRRLTAQDLHATTSSTYGTWNYTYDNAGNLTQQIDPKNQTTTYGYDGLNRVTSETFAGQTQIAYTYDTCTKGIGHLCVASSSADVASDTYNTLGQLTEEADTIASTTYTTAYTYDRQGNQLTITNPDTSEVEYTYNPAGLAQTVSYAPSGGSFTPVVTEFDYSPMDQVATETDANGVTIAHIYDPAQLYRLVDIVSTDNGSGAPQNLADENEGGGPSSGTNSTVPVPMVGSNFLIPSTTLTEVYTGSVGSFTVPTGVVALVVTAYGAQGGASAGAGGLGGEATGTLSVTSGTTYYFGVGQYGASSSAPFGGGGPPGSCPTCSQAGASGGGMTWLSSSSTFSTSTAIIVAGGGGGGGGATSGGTGGAGGTGGYPNGGSGGNGLNAFDVSDAAGGSGGTQTSGNAVGQGAVGGGEGGPSGSSGGGGGGGLWGGLGGTGASAGVLGSGGGGGGSSYLLSTLTNTSTATGVRTGSGYLVILEEIAAVPTISSLVQYQPDGVTPISEGGFTRQNNVVLGGTLNSNNTSTLQLQVEVEPAGTSLRMSPM